jgi:thymidylate synthase (FAD)
MPEVKLLAATPDALAVIVQAARTCYASEASSPESDQRLIRSLIRRGHESVLEHASATFEITCSRVVTHELVRHRIAAYSQRSQRYVRENEPTYFTPPELTGEKLDLYDEAIRSAWGAYAKLLASGVAPQIARYVLPNAALTTIVATWNFREIRHVLKLRLAPAAQPEMREVARQIRALVLEIAPPIFEGIDEVGRPASPA